MRKVLITAPAHESLISRLGQHGFEVNYMPGISYDEALAIVDDVEGLIVTTRLPIDARMLDKGEKLKWIGRLGSGMELIDTDYAASKNIECFSTPEGNRTAVAEHTLALLLNLLNNINRASGEVRRRLWLRHENRGVELSGKTVGIIGYGHTGSSFARLLEPFGVRVLAYDKYKTGYGHGFISEASLTEIFENAHVVSLHLPLTPETYHFANASFFSSFTHSPYVISTCRGKITDTAALIKALQNGQVAGAALDVLENEKLATLSETEEQQLNFLLNHPSVIITPHIAGYSQEAFIKMGDFLLEKLGLEQR